MNARQRVGMVVVLSVWALPAWAAQAPEDMKVYFVKQVTQAPALDGALDDACWKAAEVIDDFGYCGYFHNKKDLPLPRTEARFVWDGRYLYAGLTAYEKDMEATRRILANPGRTIFWRDLFELHVDANHDRRTRFQFMANPLGEKYVDASFDQGWGVQHEGAWGLSADWSVKGQFGTDRWTVEVAMALRAMGMTPKAGTHLGLNVARFRFADGSQFLTWCNQGGSHHDLKQFAHAILSGPGPVRDVRTGLKLAYADIDQRVVRLVRPTGYTVLEQGKERFLSFGATVRARAAEVRKQIADLRKQVPAAPRDKDLSHFTRALDGEDRRVEKLVKDLPADKAIGFPVAHKAQEGLDKIADRVEQLKWQLRTLLLVRPAVRP